MVSLCLNMIVRNEAPIIRRCLESCRPLISSYCIVDTGSTDGTQNAIRSALWDVPGELYERPWVDFGTNRTEAYALARPLADWVLFMDADHQLVVSDVPELGKDGSDSYYLEVENWSTVYRIIRIVKSDRVWRFEGTTHETLVCDTESVSGDLSCLRVQEYPDSTRRQTGQKAAEDLVLLEQAFARDPTDKRAAFYLAQTYYDTCQWEKAFATYAKRVAMAGPSEEVFWSLMRMAEIQQDEAGDWAKAQELYLAAYQTRPTRAEPLVILANHYNEHRMPAVAKLYAAAAMAMKPSPDDILFLTLGCYGGEFAKAEYERATA